MRRITPCLLCALIAVPLSPGVLRSAAASWGAPAAAIATQAESCAAVQFDFSPARLGLIGLAGESEVTLAPGSAAVLLRIPAESLSGCVVRWAADGAAALACRFARALQGR